ncbi:MAG: GFA family protein [Pseudomonadota bacterium]
MKTDATRAVTGGCHCGAVRFRARLHDPTIAHRCNCSMCAASGFVGVIVPAAAFELLTDRDALTEYRFNTGTARHWFCTTCGVESFYRPRSNPDGYNLNLNCLVLDPGHSVEIKDFDGQNWEAHAAALEHLSKPGSA